MTSNQAVIYSNGIADFQRRFDVDGTLQVAIPVKQDHVADVLASLHVMGDVKLSRPPTFRPANEAEGALALDVDNVLTGLARSLGGAQVRVEHGGGRLEGVLAGLHTHDEAQGGDAVQVRSLVVLAGGSLTRIPLNEVSSLSFLEPAVQAELDKALQRRVQQIKPNSTFVELELSSGSPIEAWVQYTVPAAAWKISYRLRASDSAQFELQGYAIVDNNTDEDWRDFQLAVVTGEPITFSTDLADSKSPSRRHVNVVRDEALGAVEPEMTVDSMMIENVADERYDRSAPLRKKAARAMTLGGAKSRGAAFDAAEVTETGDFCVYEASTPVSIDSGRSAVLPVFSAALGNSRSVLHYQEKNHATRPYRAVQFVNETDHSLGRGVCTVFEGGVYGGSCILPATKPGDESLLPHALETGVLVRVDRSPMRRRETGLRLSQGVVHRQFHARHELHYRIVSSRDDSNHLVLDHAHTLNQPKLTAEVALAGEPAQPLDLGETLADGVRLRVEIPPRAKLTVHVVETTVLQSEVTIAGDQKTNMSWVVQNLIRSNGPLADNPTLQACLEMRHELDAKGREIETAEQELTRLEARQERLRQNVAAGGNAQQSAKWLADLASAEDRIVALTEQRLPELQAQQQRLEEKLYETLRQLDVEWDG